MDKNGTNVILNWATLNAISTLNHDSVFIIFTQMAWNVLTVCFICLHTNLDPIWEYIEWGWSARIFLVDTARSYSKSEGDCDAAIVDKKFPLSVIFYYLLSLLFKSFFLSLW